MTRTEMVTALNLQGWEAWCTYGVYHKHRGTLTINSHVGLRGPDVWKDASLGSRSIGYEWEDIPDDTLVRLFAGVEELMGRTP